MVGGLTRGRIAFDPLMRFIPDNTKCFILFPGKSYAFYDEIRNSSLIFMDFPGFPLNGIENSNFIIDWEARVAVSDRIRRWYSEGENQTVLPPRTVSELGEFRSTRRRKLFSGLIDAFFNDISKGDLILVPPPNQNGEVLFGEILDDPGVVVKHHHPGYPEETVPARRVRWVNTTQRSVVPRWLDAKFPSPNPLRQIKFSHYPHVFDLAYERYHYKERYVCKFFVTSKRFTALNNLELQQFFLLPTALTAAETNSPSDSIYQLIKKNADNFDPLDQRIDINSPGHIVLISKTAAPFFAAMILMLACDDGTTQSKPLKVSVHNSHTSPQSRRSAKCITDMENEIEKDLELMNQKQWEEACELGLVSNKNNGLKTGVK